MVARYDNPAGGPDGLALSTDVARFGPVDAERALIAVSGTHGAEGFAGSGIQAGWLRSGRAAALPEGLAVLLIHAINPYGFAWLRRVNEDNVDINRNFIDHSAPHPGNEDYRALREHLLPERLEGAAFEAAERRLAAVAAEGGDKAILQACSGQYGDADGIFYGGKAPVWSNRTLRRIVGDHLPRVRLAAYLDLHTGLGPYGYGEPICYHPRGGAEETLARAWYGDEITTPHGGGAVSPVNVGKTGYGVMEALAPATVVCVTLEFGTKPFADVLRALRHEHWLWRHGDGASEQGRRIKAHFRDTFYCDTDDWKQMVWRRGDDFMRLAVDGLASTPVSRPCQ